MKRLHAERYFFLSYRPVEKFTLRFFRSSLESTAVFSRSLARASGLISRRDSATILPAEERARACAHVAPCTLLSETSAEIVAAVAT